MLGSAILLTITIISLAATGFLGISVKLMLCNRKCTASPAGVYDCTISVFLGRLGTPATLQKLHFGRLDYVLRTGPASMVTNNGTSAYIVNLSLVITMQLVLHKTGAA